MEASDRFADQVLAKLFGFPACCVDFYCTNKGTAALRRAKGLGGYRLCPACARKPTEQVIEAINAKRICPTPFPLPPEQSDYERIVNDPRFNAREREWLASNSQRFIGGLYEDTRVAHLHDELSQIDAALREAIDADPAREKYLIAMHELKRSDIVTAFVDELYRYYSSRR